MTTTTARSKTTVNAVGNHQRTVPCSSCPLLVKWQWHDRPRPGLAYGHREAEVDGCSGTQALQRVANEYEGFVNRRRSDS